MRRKERPKAGRVDTKILSMDSAGRHGHHAHQVAPETLRGDEHGPSMLSRPVSRSVVSSSVTSARGLFCLWNLYAIILEWIAILSEWVATAPGVGGYTRGSSQARD